MPVHSIHVLKSGTIGESFLIHAHEPGATSPRTGLRHDTPGVTAGYYREGAASPTRIELTAGTAGSWSPGGFTEVDPELMPGVYQLGVPDEMLGGGSTRAILVLRFPDAEVEPVEVDLVAYDPQDPSCIGMAQLSDERRHQFLRTALPRLTEMEYELGRQAEQDLARQKADRS